MSAMTSNSIASKLAIPSAVSLNSRVVSATSARVSGTTAPDVVAHDGDEDDQEESRGRGHAGQKERGSHCQASG